MRLGEIPLIGSRLNQCDRQRSKDQPALRRLAMIDKTCRHRRSPDATPPRHQAARPPAAPWQPSCDAPAGFRRRLVLLPLELLGFASAMDPAARSWEKKGEESLPCLTAHFRASCRQPCCPPVATDPSTPLRIGRFTASCVLVSNIMGRYLHDDRYGPISAIRC